MANRKSARTFSTADDAESPLLRSPKKMQYGIFERDHVGKSFALIILGAFAGARSAPPSNTAYNLEMRAQSEAWW